jgi:hypothetical protein
MGGTQAVEHLEGGLLAKALLFVCGMMFGFVLEVVMKDE